MDIAKTATSIVCRTHINKTICTLSPFSGRRSCDTTHNNNKMTLERKIHHNEYRDGMVVRYRLNGVTSFKSSEVIVDVLLV